MTAVYEWVADLFVVTLLALAAAGAVFVGLTGPARIVVLMPMVLFLPGYAMVSALFPEGTPRSRSLRTLNRAQLDDPTGAGYRRIGPTERLVLAVALSLAILPLTAYALNFTPFRIATLPLVAILTGWTLLFVVLAAVRRGFVAADERFSAGSLVPSGVFGSFGGSTYSLLFVGSLLVLAASAGVAGFASPAQDQFTETYLVTEQGGNVTTENVGETARNGGTIQLAITNQEGEQVEYTTVVQVEQVQNGGVSSAETVDTFTTTVADGETERSPYQVQQSGGSNTRLAFLVYEGEPPSNPSRDNAYRVVHVWLSAPNGQQSLAAPSAEAV
ncbi:Uncharacterized membrane protein [Halogranum rubrum]|uniref:Uncharacterized membrane protein n=1 Tax=Halogranum rubrum TaxID=553466 RepID=A0A1I4IJL8_9EURY|nr:DUF1616 domain-containing protein [Halogranum rubrum]SFL53966.1 Uncharacterized membrane protein [Halogranum rubrum]